MKTFTIAFLSLMLFSFCSCQEESPNNDAEMDLSNIQIDLPNLQLGEFKVPNDPERRAEFFKIVFKEISDSLNAHDNIDFYTFNLFISIEETVLKDIESGKFDIRASDPDPFGRCPDGWDLIGIALSASEAEALVAEGFADVSGIGDCKQVQVKVGIMGASVCSRDC